MEVPPEDIDESAVRRALRAWGIDAVSAAYAPVGFGDHHWTAAGADGRRWFVTVADPAGKEWCGRGREAAFRGLRRAMDTASELRARAGLEFVVAPLRSAGGETVRGLGERYAVSVFPYADGRPGRFGRPLAPGRRDRVVETLAALHRAAPPARAPVHRPELPGRTRLAEALDGLGSPWRGGPFSEPARALVADRSRALRRRLAEFDRRAGELLRKAPEPVVTHGEPHPGNLLWRPDGRPLLVDWDTVGLAVPERDLWLVADGPDGLERYAEATGRAPDPSALALYRLRWALDDLTAFLDCFRSPHTRTADTETAWRGLADTVARLAGDGAAHP
ncbi:aminoglycoside phosphotransferase family protein [Streptomyces sp. TRM 70361]|uniref:phosphotransferase enzyme family protein n=1 Tax=Streptomyces sp. TRM 70361 TaxID=3116553 RepID=UPI002E7C56AE|nr:aminoglycoside phosphotransferase family protein [Streptomyces sp. TRM 70361]MEE1942964.1 aminoglycoside phosphotransferase family protein [Streptomyces sp. TRM 70361]